MSKRGNSGCIVAAVIGLLCVGGVVTLVFILFMAKSSHDDQMAMVEFMGVDSERREQAGECGVFLSESALQHYGVEVPETGLTKEHYIAVAYSPRFTQLSKDRFYQQAEGQVVTWLLEVDDVEAKDGMIVADLGFEYEFSYDGGRGTSGGSSSVEAHFSEDQEEALVKYQSGDVIKVTGKLSFEQGTQLLGAKVVK